MKWLALILLLLSPLAHAAVPCGTGVTSGTLTLRVSEPRIIGVSPLFVWFDATATTDTATLAGANNVTQDVYVTWDYGDTGVSGQGQWSYGANGINNKNKSKGIVGGHLYVLPIGATTDVSYTTQVWATDGTNIASCTIPVTVQAPSGTNGFTPANTFCAFNTSLGSCPAGVPVANQITTSSYVTALGHLGSGKRVLFKCGDTFTSAGPFFITSMVKWSIGAYGGCENTTNSRPIIVSTTAGNAPRTSVLEIGDPNISGGAVPGDGRIADLNFQEVSGTSPQYAISNDPITGTPVPYQITMWNLASTINRGCYQFNQGAQTALVGSTCTALANASDISVYFNGGQYNPPYTGNVFNNLDYQAAIGNQAHGVGCCGSGGGSETFRFGGGTRFIISNNTLTDSNSVGATLKVHEGNTHNSNTTWIGLYTELGEISDNVFGGNSGGNLTEVCAEDQSNRDERLRNIVIEGNFFAVPTPNSGGRQMLLCASNATVRNNVFYLQGTSSLYAKFGLQYTQRGSPAGGGAPPVGGEVYNNTCYSFTNSNPHFCIGFDNSNNTPGIPCNNCFAQNNLYFDANNSATVSNTGTGTGTNVVIPNTSASNVNPGFANGSGGFTLLTDFKPTSAATGAVTVPNYFDATGLSWIGAYQLGALSNRAGGNIIFSQPAENGIVAWNGTSGTFIVPAKQGAVPTGQWVLALQPTSLSNCYQASGLLVPLSSANAGNLTGFTVSNPASSQLAFQNIAGSSVAQMDGGTVGAYINSLDAGCGTDPATDQKMMVSATYIWASPFQTVWPGNTLHGSMTLKIPTGVETGSANTYLKFSYLFSGPSGVLVDIDAAIFNVGGFNSNLCNTSFDSPSQNYIMSCPLGIDQTYLTKGANSANGTGATFNTPTFFAWDISQTLFGSILTKLHTDFPSANPPISTDPTQFTLKQIHINAEFHSQGAHAELGWSMSGLTIWQQ